MIPRISKLTLALIVGETTGVIDAAVAAQAAQTTRACGSQIAARLQWKAFATPGARSTAPTRARCSRRTGR